MKPAYQALEGRPELPEELPVPAHNLEESSRWWTLEAEDGTTLYGTFSGNGRHPTIMVGWLYTIPPAGLEELDAAALEGRPMRWPYLEELYAFVALCELEGVVWELPHFHAGHAEAAMSGPGCLLMCRQRGALDQTEAALRFKLSVGVQGNGPAIVPN